MPALLRILAGLSAAVVLTGCGRGSATATPPEPSPMITNTATTAATPAPSTNATAAAPLTSTPHPASTRPGEPIVPDVVGMRLPEAKKRLAMQGYPKVAQVDATGQGRRVVNADNWVVRSQVPVAGSPLTPGATVTLRVGKPTDGVGSASTTVDVIPNVVCKDLHSAQETLKRAGFDNVTSQDAT
jgi:hypothetical protein